MKRGPQKYLVPLGAPKSRCKCGLVMHWIKTKTGARMPIDVTAEGCSAPTAKQMGVGIPHFATCKFAAEFSGRSKKSSAQPPDGEAA